MKYTIKFGKPIDGIGKTCDFVAPNKKSRNDQIREFADIAKMHRTTLKVYIDKSSRGVFVN
jgi:hypothetical protein